MSDTVTAIMFAITTGATLIGLHARAAMLDARQDVKDYQADAAAARQELAVQRGINQSLEGEVDRLAEEVIERRQEVSDLEVENGALKQVEADTDREANHWASKFHEVAAGMGAAALVAVGKHPPEGEKLAPGVYKQAAA